MLPWWAGPIFWTLILILLYWYKRTEDAGRTRQDRRDLRAIRKYRGYL